ncbi:MAG TPA: LPS assembly lipoprotein LptE [Candidatus Hydrogenedentes bacterium]|nr:LPS assembly lipoprotein LptE [Candidatus Hydrogenedentota bacterium]HOL77116.1 LPS assembly lipoprotein LptE [Candidatus Hydrogenedentota bacterium]HPO86965.1 LPS assembly lipoprotein LptE [Candidatus Hydrogenedentota bacterium]
MTAKRLVLLVMFASGCATTSKPIHYYTLDMTPSGKALCSRGIVIEIFRSAEPLLRRNIMIKATPTQVEYYAADEWVASVDELVTQKLRAELGENNPQRREAVLSGTVLAFEQQDTTNGARAYAKVHVTVRKWQDAREKEWLLEKTYDAAVDMKAPKPGAAAEALSRALEQIAAQIAADIQNLPL